MRTESIVPGMLGRKRERGWGLIYEQLLFTAERDFDRTNSEPVLLIGHEISLYPGIYYIFVRLIGHEESSHPFAKARSPSTE